MVASVYESAKLARAEVEEGHVDDNVARENVALNLAGIDLGEKAPRAYSDDIEQLNLFVDDESMAGSEMQLE